MKGAVRDLAKGSAEIAAKFIKKALGGDLFEIKTVKTYSADEHVCAEEEKRTAGERSWNRSDILGTRSATTFRPRSFLRENLLPRDIHTV